jgi:hypothetical protein
MAALPEVLCDIVNMVADFMVKMLLCQQRNRMICIEPTGKKVDACEACYRVHAC